MMKWSKHGLWSSFSWVDLSLSNCPLACLLVFLAKYLLSTCCVTLDKLLYPSETYSSLANWKLAPQRLSCKEPTWVRKIPWRRKWLPTPAAFLDNTKDRGAWQATVHGITKSQTWLSDFHFTSLHFPSSLVSKEFACDSGDLDSIPGPGRFPWRRKRQPNPVFLPGKSHGERSLGSSWTSGL